MFNVGTRVYATENIDYDGTIHIVGGSRGRVSATECEAPGLEGYEVTWDNGLVTWFAEDDTVPVARSWLPRVPEYAASLAAAFALGWVVPDYFEGRFDVAQAAIENPVDTLVQLSEPLLLLLTNIFTMIGVS